MSRGFAPIQGISATSLQNPSAIAQQQLGIAIDVKCDYGASGSAESTTGTISLSSPNVLTLASAIDFKNGQGISVAGAGASGALLVTTILAGAGTTTLYLVANASTAVTGATVNHDDTAAIQAAVDAAAVSGSKVYLPQGQYMISSAISVTTNGLVIEDAGRYTTIIRQSVAGQHGLSISNASYVTVHDLWISSTSAATGDGIYLSHANACITENVQIDSFTGDGLHLDQQCYLQLVKGVRIHNVTGNGCYLGTATNACTLVDLEVNIAAIGLCIGASGNSGTPSLGVAVLGGSFEGGVAAGIRINYAQGVSIQGSYFEGSGLIIGDSAATNFSVNGCKVSGCNFDATDSYPNAQGISIHTTVGCSIDNCSFGWANSPNATGVVIASDY